MKNDATELEALTTLPEIAARLLPLRPEEAAALRDSIQTEGIRDPIVIWPLDGQLILVDGHHRLAIAQELGLPCPYRLRHFADLDEALDWIDRNQLARRNLTDEQFMLVVGRIYQRQKRNKWANLKQFAPKAQFELSVPEGANATAKRVAGDLGLSQATVRRAEKFAQAVEVLHQANPVAAERVLRGQVKDALTRLPELARQTDAETFQAVAGRLADGAESVQEAWRDVRRQQLAEQASERAAGYAADPSLAGVVGDYVANHVYQADVRQVRLPAECADMVFTDPPYADEHLPLYQALAEFAAHVLVPGGFLLAYCGKLFIPNILAFFQRAGLEYVLLYAVVQPGNNQKLYARHVFEGYRPVACFRKPGPQRPVGWHNDAVSEARDKALHDWQQGIEAALRWLAAYTSPGDLVIDPFCGSGTTLVACQQLGRRFLGFDIDPQAAALARARLAGAAKTEDLRGFATGIQETEEGACVCQG